MMVPPITGLRPPTAGLVIFTGGIVREIGQRGVGLNCVCTQRGMALDISSYMVACPADLGNRYCICRFASVSSMIPPALVSSIGPVLGSIELDRAVLRPAE